MTIDPADPPVLDAARPSADAPSHDAVRSSPLIPLWAAMVLAAAAGGLLTLAYPAVSLWILAFPAVALLLIAVIGRSAWASFLVGLVYGVVFSVILVSWTGRYLGPIPWLALGLLEGFLTAVTIVPIALAYRWMPRLVRGPILRGVLTAAVVAALWIGRELFLGSWPYGGFPWARIGMVMSETASAHVSSWLGVSGLGFLMVFLSALCVELIRGRARPRLPAFIAPALLVGALAFTPLFPTTATGTMRIGAVQGNGPAGYFDVRKPLSVLDAQVEATVPLYGEGLDLLVWPEGGVDADPFQNLAAARTLTSMAERSGAPVLANAATADDDNFYNTSFLWPVDAPWDLARDDVQTHAKRHPVPFGEYVPDRAFFNAIVPDLIGLIQREYTPGTDAPIVRVGERVVGLAICFDVIYDEVIRQGISEGAEVLVFQTNNADFRGTAENLQQLAIARMRAVETGRAVVNISTVGTSQVIGADGTTRASVDADRPGALVEDVELRTGATAGVVIGPFLEQLLLWGGLLMVVGAGIVSRIRRSGEGR
ncbi:apolipoprotein N-acyltransferase [Microbacterium resistens]|uniref:Apolipoprotein N-acyltransferase n=1 Tax=Microbacterium resistens TaxID=156977 RepID=A0ABU1SF32_9MICO|nr:apolipoprotein N-acyltransferase [Microbacterium resistens]MDR6868211.1 apolipoprotein N-acyltransferase [Microbacterium resistens]